MAVKSVRIELNRPGIVALLQSQAVADELAARGARISEAAGGQDDFPVRVAKNRDRVVVFVTTATAQAMRAEAEDGVLTRALDAGR